MKLALGLPSTFPDTDMATLREWAIQGEQAGFDSLAASERLAGDTVDPIVALSVAAAVTTRPRLLTAALLASARPGSAYLAAQLAALDRLSDGRLSVGVGIGNRREEYDHAGLPFERRGRLMDECLAELQRIWSEAQQGADSAIGPAPVQPGGPEILGTGYVPASFRRIARFGNGWIAGSGSRDRFRELGEAADRAWVEAGRAGLPRKLAQVHFGLGADALQPARDHLVDTYGYLGSERIEKMLGGLVNDGDALAARLAGLEEAGCDEAILVPCVDDPVQISRLYDVVRAPTPQL